MKHNGEHTPDENANITKDPDRSENNNATFIHSFLDKLPWNTTFDQSRVNVRLRQEESLYRNQFRSLLRQHRNSLSSALSSPAIDDPSIYAAENAILKSVVHSEQIAIASGFLAFLATFASIRYGPTLFITKFGSEAKVKAFRESQREFKEKNNTVVDHMAQLTVNVIQASMAGWVGVRTYETVSTNQKDSFSQIASIPLVPGRSAISDSLCPPWIAAYRPIPLTFWKVKRDDAREWKAIRLFATNCQQRMEYEKRLLREQQPNGSDHTNIIIRNVVLPFAVDKVIKLEDVLSKEEIDLDDVGQDTD